MLSLSFGWEPIQPGYIEAAKDAPGKQFTSAVVKTPEWATFMLKSTLPREK
ncbi:MAG TPA: hypothetical protein VFS61_02490 [Anaerolineales bacterium]|nr:hypothetical protein [Anaerolineales bacterium]